LIRGIFVIRTPKYSLGGGWTLAEVLKMFLSSVRKFAFTRTFAV
jgi:hypothetical protein